MSPLFERSDIRRIIIKGENFRSHTSFVLSHMVDFTSVSMSGFND